MSPYEIKLLLDIFCIADWYESRSEPIFVGTLSNFETNGLIELGGSISTAKLTIKGRAHVSQLCNLPFPQEIKQWVDHTGNPIPNI